MQVFFSTAKLLNINHFLPSHPLMPQSLLPKLSQPVCTDATSLAQFSKDMVYAGAPDFALKARDWQEVSEVLSTCHQQEIPVTPCGSQTSMTGSSVADSGLALSLTSLNKILELKKQSDGTALIDCEPGVILGDLKCYATKNGYFYPPDPTSFNEATLGATVATNATGEDTYAYGPTRRYVEALEILTADGRPQILTRQKPVANSILKNTAGYFLDGEPIDALIGSEGTLAVFKKITVRVLSAQGRDTALLILPFSDFAKTLAAVQLLDGAKFKPRAIELIGPGAADYFKLHTACPSELKNEGCFLCVKIEYDASNSIDPVLDSWMTPLTNIYNAVSDTPCLARVFVATTHAQKEAIRLCRHFIPLKVNEDYFPYREQGGGKIGTDWWVPLKHLQDMLLPTFEQATTLQIPFLVFAHIGNGHPHWNFLTRNPEENAKAKAFVLAQCHKAVAFGGGVAGEHGIGKIKRDLLTIQHGTDTIARMKALKHQWDPKNLLGRGNLFTPNNGKA